jgi:hypothetical protein
VTPTAELLAPRAPGAVEPDVVGRLPFERTAERMRRAAPRPRLSRAGDWPRTTRILPWMLAAMMAVVWLVPFNVIQLTISLPIDLKFDRLVLPVIFAVWALMLAIGGPLAPVIRWTWIHTAIGAVLACACLSLVVDARYLNQTLEFLTSTKKLTLLLSYAMLFVIVASSIRRAEVPAFLKYTLFLAVLCALGTIWEYRFHYNVFYAWSEKLLPGPFSVASLTESSAVDEIGRRIVIGPAEISLEVAAMLSMGLPIALVGIMSSPRWRGRLLYGLAASILMAGAISTYRKTALIAPVSAILTLAYYRRRDLIRLAPLGVIVLIAVHLLSPGAFGAITEQLHPQRLGAVSTVSDRTSDYDAVRPDVLTHLAFGRGYGSYEHTSYRVLDMEMLREVIEVGVVGLAAYIMLMVSIVATASAPIRRRSPDESRVALAAAATAVSFLVISTLFDVMSFPHCPYILLWMAGLLAVVVTQPPPDEQPAPVAS